MKETKFTGTDSEALAMMQGNTAVELTEQEELALRLLEKIEAEELRLGRKLTEDEEEAILEKLL